MSNENDIYQHMLDCERYNKDRIANGFRIFKNRR